MSLSINTFILGPLQNNTYLLSDPDSKEAVIIDPSFDIEEVLEYIQVNGLTLSKILITHAHFDHVVGVNTIIKTFGPGIPIGLHPADLPLWRQGSGAEIFGLRFEPAARPSIHFYQGQVLSIGSEKLEVKQTPGHSRGHVIFHYLPKNIVFCGDLIFSGSIGRTDLPGGSAVEILHSIRTQILTLPPETRLLSGHGPETTVETESQTNPYLA